MGLPRPMLQASGFARMDKNQITVSVNDTEKNGDIYDWILKKKKHRLQATWLNDPKFDEDRIHDATFNNVSLTISCLMHFSRHPAPHLWTKTIQEKTRDQSTKLRNTQIQLCRYGNKEKEEEYPTNCKIGNMTAKTNIILCIFARNACSCQV